ncbi:hypothetical protein DPMN_045143 [Dreissena polymorpha]|uniref:Uncharacterized protein n=1 Tax=Dreissena polymorpha TaxID=45954 RepID=A0A9D4D5F9_DREPO|nr:hypothetical protein DPMN_045143 [Dreissena polymorpha]
MFFPIITTIFKLVRDIHITNVLTKFHDEEKTPWRRCFFTDSNIFELNCCIEETNVLTKFHEDWAKNLSSRLFTCLHCIHIEKTAPPPCGDVFPPIMTIFELVRDIYKIDRSYFLPIQTIFELNLVTCFHYIHIEKTAPPSGGHVFSPIWTIFELFHDDWATMWLLENTAPPTGRHVFQRIGTIFELNQHII